MTRKTSRFLPLASLLLAACGGSMEPSADAAPPDAVAEAMRSSWSRSAATAYVVHGINGKDLGLAESLPVDVQVGDACALNGFQFRDIAGPISLPPAPT